MTIYTSGPIVEQINAGANSTTTNPLSNATITAFANDYITKVVAWFDAALTRETEGVANHDFAATPYSYTDPGGSTVQQIHVHGSTTPARGHIWYRLPGRFATEPIWLRLGFRFSRETNGGTTVQYLMSHQVAVVASKLATPGLSSTGGAEMESRYFSSAGAAVAADKSASPTTWQMCVLDDYVAWWYGADLTRNHGWMLVERLRTPSGAVPAFDRRGVACYRFSPWISNGNAATRAIWILNQWANRLTSYSTIIPYLFPAGVTAAGAASAGDNVWIAAPYWWGPGHHTSEGVIAYQNNSVAADSIVSVPSRFTPAVNRSYRVPPVALTNELFNTTWNTAIRWE